MRGMFTVSTESQIVVTFRKRLKSIMADKGVSQTELADRAEMARPYVNRLLQGKQVPRIDIVEKLAKSLDVPPTALFS